MYHIQGKEVPSKKKVYPSYLYKEWEDLTIKKNFTNDVIVKHSSEVVTLKKGLDQVLNLFYNLNQSNAKNAMLLYLNLKMANFGVHQLIQNDNTKIVFLSTIQTSQNEWPSSMVVVEL